MHFGCIFEEISSLRQDALQDRSNGVELQQAIYLLKDSTEGLASMHAEMAALRAENVGLKAHLLEQEARFSSTIHTSVPSADSTSGKGPSASSDLKALARLESRVSVLESAKAPVAAGTSRPSTRPSVHGHTAAPATRSPAAPMAPAPAPVTTLSYAQVAGKAKKAGLTKESIEKAVDPLKLLLVQPREAGEKTQDVVTLVLKAPLTLEAQAKPYLAWKGLLKAKTGMLPLSMILISPRRCLTYWDVTAEDSLPELIKALCRSGFLEDPLHSDSVDKALRLRAYLGSYFTILRRAALEGLSAEDRIWLLDKAETRWKTSVDKVAQRMWMKRIRRDRGEEAAEIPLGESWTFTSSEWVNALVVSFKAESGDIERAQDSRRSLKLAPESEFDEDVIMAELDEDVIMAEPRASVKRANSRPSSVAEDEEDSADDVSMDD